MTNDTYPSIAGGSSLNGYMTVMELLIQEPANDRQCLSGGFSSRDGCHV